MDQIICKIGGDFTKPQENTYFVWPTSGNGIIINSYLNNEYTKQCDDDCDCNNILLSK